MTQARRSGTTSSLTVAIDTGIDPEDDASWRPSHPRTAAVAPPRRPPGPRATPPRAAMTPLLFAARPLFEQVQALRRAPPPPDPRALRARLLQAVQRFDERARAQGVEPGHRHIASYLLCTMLDETVARTRWAASCGWPRRGLLVSRHGEGFGGERFFELAGRACAEPARHAPLLELMALMLGLGFEGRYALVPEGPRHLEAWRRRLLHAVSRVAPLPRPGRCGAVPWPSRAVGEAAARPGRRRVAMVASAALFLVAVLVLDRIAAARVQAAANRAMAGLASLRVVAVPDSSAPAVAVPAPDRAPTAGRTRLAQVLRREIDAGWVDVEESAGRSRVTLVGDQFYEPGDARVRRWHLALLARVAAALDQVPGRIVVAGHTDDRPVRPGGGWDSNQALSLARARQVAALLAPALRDAGRLRTEGWADRHPRASNATAAGRARNRRVEITLLEDGNDGVPAPTP